MQTRTFISFTLAIGAALGATSSAYALTWPEHAVTARQAAPMLREIPDPELATMRGRFMLGNNTVAYFGVTMASSWATSSGQVLNGSAVLGMQFGDKGQAPVVTFTPTMTIVQGTSLPATGADNATRSVDGSGLANVDGLVQGIQVAGDGNRAVNVTALRIGHATDGVATGSATSTSGAYDAETSSDGALVAIAFDPARGVSLTLGVDGQGLVSQWIRSGSVGQLVQLTSDGQSVRNQLQIDLALDAAGTSNAAMQAASQALLQSRLVSPGG